MLNCNLIEIIDIQIAVENQIENLKNKFNAKAYEFRKDEIANEITEYEKLLDKIVTERKNIVDI